MSNLRILKSFYEILSTVRHEYVETHPDGRCFALRLAEFLFEMGQLLVESWWQIEKENKE